MPSYGAMATQMETISNPEGQTIMEHHNQMGGGTQQRFFQARPTTENKTKRPNARSKNAIVQAKASAQICSGDDRQSLMNYSSRLRHSSNPQGKPVQQVSMRQAALISKKGFLRREQFTASITSQEYAAIQMSKSLGASIRTTGGKYAAANQQQHY